MDDIRALEDLAPTAELRPLGHHPDPIGWTSTIPGLALVGACVAAAFGLSHLVPTISPLVVAVALGALLTNLGLHPHWARAGTHLAAKRFLRLGVILLGFQLALGQVVALGGPGLALVLVVVAATFYGTQRLGRILGISPSLSLLIATGFSICGASAIAAMDGVSDADDEEVAFAVALVTLCGSLAIAVLPALAGPLGLDGTAFGTWVGASVHDVAQVVAAASTHGPASLRAAVIVKLTRVILLAPMVAGVTLTRRRRTTPTNPVDTTTTAARRPPILPLFVALFLAAIAIRTTGILPTPALDAIKTTETISLAAALVGLGTGVHLAKLRRLGGRPLLLAACSWILIAGLSYLGVRLLGA